MARKDGPSLLRSQSPFDIAAAVVGADPLVVVVLVVCCVGICCIEIVSSSRCSSNNDLDFGGMDLLDIFSNRMD